MTGDGQKFQLLKQTNEIFPKCKGMLAFSPVAKYIGLTSNLHLKRGGSGKSLENLMFGWKDCWGEAQATFLWKATSTQVSLNQEGDQSINHLVGQFLYVAAYQHTVISLLVYIPHVIIIQPGD